MKDSPISPARKVSSLSSAASKSYRARTFIATGVGTVSASTRGYSEPPAAPAPAPAAPPDPLESRSDNAMARASSSCSRLSAAVRTVCERPLFKIIIHKNQCGCLFHGSFFVLEVDIKCELGKTTCQESVDLREELLACLDISIFTVLALANWVIARLKRGIRKRHMKIVKFNETIQ